MPKTDYIFIDESGDHGYALDRRTGELASSPHYVLSALHVTDDSIRLINRHLAAFRYCTGFVRELKFPPEREAFARLMDPIRELAMSGADIFASAVFLDKREYSGRHLKPKDPRGPQSAQRFRNRILRCLLEHHFTNHALRSNQYELILDRIGMTPSQMQDLRTYLQTKGGFPQPAYIVEVASICVEGLQVVDHIARGFKNVVSGSDIPKPLEFVISRNITQSRGLREI